MNAQNNEDRPLPYQQIPDYPETYTPATIVSRMIDGLGYRYYWASEGLKETDMEGRLVEGSRSVLELLQHIHGLSEVILNTAEKKPTIRNQGTASIQDADLLRENTLRNFKKSSELFASSTDISSHSITFISRDGQRNYPFWNQINGPIEDAVWHSGQLVTIRRVLGNPIPPGVNVFLGVTKK